MAELVVQGGRVRPSKLKLAEAASIAATQALDAKGGISSPAQASKASFSIDPSKIPDNVSPEDVAQAVTDAEAGDQAAIDWLKTLGLIGGTAAAVGGGYLLSKALRNRNQKTSTTKSTATTTAVSKTATPKSDLYIDLPKTEYKEKLIKLPKAAPKPRLNMKSTVKALKGL
jgi:hypothetical protein